MTAPGAPADLSEPNRVVRQSVISFGLWSLLAMFVLVVAILLSTRHVAKVQAEDAAATRGQQVADRLVAPLVDHAVRAQEPGAADALEAMLRPGFKDGSFERVKVWDEDGTVIWSDEKALVGQQFPLSDEVQALFRSQDTLAHLTELDRPENVAERDMNQLLEVYAGTRDVDGEPLVFEAYLPTRPIREEQDAILTAVLPTAVASLVLLQLAMIPMGVSLARRVQRSEAAHSRMTAHALLASELERRRIAQELHDGVVQDLAGVGFALPGIERGLAEGPEGQEARGTLDQVREIIRQGVGDLRSMMIEIYPPDLSGPGLAPALEDLAERRREQGIAVDVEVRGPTDFPLDTSRLVYRVVREGLQNVDKHSGARRALVQVLRHDDEVVVRVADDGGGVRAAGVAAPGHLGLRLLEDAIRDKAGSMRLATVVTPPGLGGALLEARLPLRTP